MTFEDFENLLEGIGDVDPIGIEYGSDDYIVRLWRCCGNSSVCQIRKLYNKISDAVKYSNQVSYYKGKADAYKELVKENYNGEVEK